MNTEEKINQLMEEAEARQRIIEQNGNDGLHYEEKEDEILEMMKEHREKNKYKVKCKEIHIDVYDVLWAFDVINPAIQHAIKKLLKGGERGYKDEEQDYNEAVQSITRGIELIK